MLLPDNWPAMSVDEAHSLMTAPNNLFEMETVDIRGQDIRVYKNAPRSLREVFDASIAFGDREFIVYETERLSYALHHKAVCVLAGQLTSRYGVAKGDRVAIAMRNYPEWSIAFWAASCIGAIVVPLNAWLTGEELEYALADCGATVLICDHDRLERIRPHLTALPSLKHRLVCRTAAPHADADSWGNIVAAPGRYDALAEIAIPDVQIDPDDDATIFYTSGTTGKPKGALGTHRNICTNLISTAVHGVRAILRRGEQPPEPDPEAPAKSFLLTVPFFHATGCHSVLVPTLFAGNRIVLVYRWDPDEAIELIARERINAFGGVPTMAWQIIEHPRLAEYDLSCVESVAYGGAPSAPELVRRIMETFPLVSPGNGYGLTETSSVTTQHSAEDYRNRPASAGPAVPVCDLRVVDEQGNDVPTGEIGELWIRGPNVVKGYWNKPEATAESFVDGWLRSGDLVTMDDEGFVTILDRAKDMLIRGGENIYCVEVENALYSHPAVMDAAVVGIEHRELGEEVGAVVHLSPGTAANEAELREHVASQLAGFKVPKRILFQEQTLPRNANGKILKRELKALFL